MRAIISIVVFDPKFVAQYSVGRISEWGGGVTIEAPRGVGWGGGGGGGGVSASPLGKGSGEGAVPPPQKNFAFLHQNHTSVMHSDTLLK